MIRIIVPLFISLLLFSCNRAGKILDVSDYKLPTKIITYIGPLDGYGDALSGDELLIGLHHHLGATSSAYQSTWFQETYPDYIYKQFEPSYIPINCAKNILNDIYPEKEND